MRSNPRPAGSTAPPRPGDLVSCVSCGRVNVHDRVLMLSPCCGRGIHVVDRRRARRPLLSRLVDRLKPTSAQGWLA